MDVWKKRMSRPLDGALRGLPNNWQAYAMRGEWLRAKAGLVDHDVALTYVETSWKQGQANRLGNDPWGLYHDGSSDPDALAVDPVGRDNLTGMLLAGYDGPSAARMKELLLKGARSSLFLQDPAGQAPGGGRNSRPRQACGGSRVPRPEAMAAAGRDILGDEESLQSCRARRLLTGELFHQLQCRPSVPSDGSL